MTFGAALGSPGVGLVLGAAVWVAMGHLLNEYPSSPE